MQEISTKPYLLRALYEWCTDNGFTPHLAVKVDNRTRVPREFVRDGEIVLNISFEATSQLHMSNDLIEFFARFSGRSYKIEVLVSNVLAIYARENGQGMAFSVDDASDDIVREGMPAYEPLPMNACYDIPEDNTQLSHGKAAREAAKSTRISSVPKKARAENAPGTPSSEALTHTDAPANVRPLAPRSGDRKHLKIIK